MQVCLSYQEGWFLRINTRDVPRPCVAISQTDNEWLDHDSHVECALLVFDEFEIEEAIRAGGPIGTLTEAVKPEILRKLVGQPYLREADKQVLRRLLA